MNYGRHKKVGIREMYANRHEPEQIRAFADVYWHVLLSVAVVIVLLATAYGVMELFSVLGDAGKSLMSEISSQPRSMLNRAELQSTLDAFQARQRLFESLKTKAPKIDDPSR